MQIKNVSVTTTDSTVEFDQGYQYAWVKNTGDDTAYLSDKSIGDVKTEGVATIKSGECGMVTINNGVLHCISDSTTTLEVKAQNVPNCPFGKSGGSSGGGGGGSAKINYSLTEQDTGVKWVDGKAVYQRTFELDYDEKSGNNWIICPTTDIDNLMRVEAVDTTNRRCLGGIDGVDITSTKIDDIWYFVIDTFFKYVTFWYTKK